MTLSLSPNPLLSLDTENLRKWQVEMHTTSNVFAAAFLVCGNVVWAEMKTSNSLLEDAKCLAETFVDCLLLQHC